MSMVQATASLPKMEVYYAAVGIRLEATSPVPRVKTCNHNSLTFITTTSPRHLLPQVPCDDRSCQTRLGSRAPAPRSCFPVLEALCLSEYHRSVLPYDFIAPRLPCSPPSECHCPKGIVTSDQCHKPVISPPRVLWLLFPRVFGRVHRVRASLREHVYKLLPRFPFP